MPAGRERTIGSSGVMPMPPARNRYRSAGTSGKRLNGPRTRSRVPGPTEVWISAEPPLPARSRSTPSR